MQEIKLPEGMSLKNNTPITDTIGFIIIWIVGVLRHRRLLVGMCIIRDMHPDTRKRGRARTSPLGSGGLPQILHAARPASSGTGYRRWYRRITLHGRQFSDSQYASMLAWDYGLTLADDFINGHRAAPTGRVWNYKAGLPQLQKVASHELPKMRSPDRT